jgi:hypothetical protein
MERHRGVSPCGSAPFPGENVSQHLRNGALRKIAETSCGGELRQIELTDSHVKDEETRTR